MDLRGELETHGGKGMTADDLSVWAPPAGTRFLSGDDDREAVVILSESESGVSFKRGGAEGRYTGWLEALRKGKVTVTWCPLLGDNPGPLRYCLMHGCIPSFPAGTRFSMKGETHLVLPEDSGLEGHVLVRSGRYGDEPHSVLDVNKLRMSWMAGLLDIL